MNPQKSNTNETLTEGQDYYLNEQGLFTFTENYLLQRGYCCGNGCLHCPYNKDKNRVDLPKVFIQTSQ